MEEHLECDVYKEPFPHLIVKNFYNEEELELIWEELKFYTHPGKLLEAEGFGGVVGKTNSHAIVLNDLYNPNAIGVISNIVRIIQDNKKYFNDYVEKFSKIHDCCSGFVDWDQSTTKVRYYHDGEYYIPHRDTSYSWLLFSYFHKKPKKFTGGELFFPDYDYEVPCTNNSMIVFPGWVKHGVNKVSIEDSDYFDGWGRYAITSFFGCRDKKTNNKNDDDNKGEGLDFMQRIRVKGGIKTSPPPE